MDSDSDSSLSSAPEEEVRKLAPIFAKAKKATKLVAPPPAVSPPRPKRPPSPPHEVVLADSPDIAFLVMFRSRFHEAFPGKTPHFGPQDIERGVVDSVPSPEIQSLLCALLGLVLNRKKPVERGHHGRALEEAVLSHKSQWPLKWGFQNPLHGGRDFNAMSPAERLNLLRTLVMWALGSSDVISGMMKDKYKQVRHGDDENQPLSVQPWGLDGDKRRYFLVQGLDDTGFRVYREGSRYTKNAHWYSMAGTIDEVKALATKLEKVDASQAARRLAVKMNNAVPTFEATEEKRRRREYRQQRRAAFTRPEPGFGIYEGRTRGKRPRYTFEDDDDDASMSDATSTRRSTRQHSTRSTPFEGGPTYTASGRQIKQPRTGEYGESLLSSNVMNMDDLAPDYETTSGRSGRAGSDESDPVRGGGRATRSGAGKSAANGHVNPRKRKHIEGYNSIDEMSDEDDAAPSGDEWDSDRNAGDEDNDDRGSDASDQEDEQQSLVVKLKIPSSTLGQRDTPPTSPPSAEDESQTIKAKTEISSPPISRTPSVAAAAGAAQSFTTEVPMSNETPGDSAHLVPASLECSKSSTNPSLSPALPDPRGISSTTESLQSAQYRAPSAMQPNGYIPTPAASVPALGNMQDTGA